MRETADEVQEEEGLRFTTQSDPTASGSLDRRAVDDSWGFFFNGG